MQTLRRALKRAINSTEDIVSAVSASQPLRGSKRLKNGEASDHPASQPVNVPRDAMYSDIFDTVLARARAATSDPRDIVTADDAASDEGEVPDSASMSSVIDHGRLHRELLIMLEIIHEQRLAIDAMDAKINAGLMFIGISPDAIPSVYPPRTPAPVPGSINISGPPRASAASADTLYAAVGQNCRSTATSRHPVRPNTNGRFFQHSAAAPAGGGGVHNPGSDSRVHRSVALTDADEHTTMLVHRTLTDVSRRKRNVVVSGLIEDERCDDRAAFLDLCETWLLFKPVLAEGSCIRIGKQMPGRPRRMLVRTGSEETAAELLRVARLLRQADDVDVSEKVFFNPDLSPAAAKLAYERRRSRRDARQQVQDEYDDKPRHQEPSRQPVYAFAAPTAPSTVHEMNMPSSAPVSAAPGSAVSQPPRGTNVQAPVFDPAVPTAAASAVPPPSVGAIAANPLLQETFNASMPGTNTDTAGSSAPEQ